MSNKQELISLYDYLGHAAGGELGKRVAEYHKSSNIKTKIGTRRVSKSKYEGELMLYERQFLDHYFNPNNRPEYDIIELNTQLMEDSFNNN
jgi:hypothetical protein